MRRDKIFIKWYDLGRIVVTIPVSNIYDKVIYIYILLCHVLPFTSAPPEISQAGIQRHQPTSSRRQDTPFSLGLYHCGSL